MFNATIFMLLNFWISILSGSHVSLRQSAAFTPFAHHYSLFVAPWITITCSFKEQEQQLT